MHMSTTYTCAYQIDIVKWLSSGCTTPVPLPEGRPPPLYMCMTKPYGYELSRFVEIYPNVYPGFVMHMQWGGGSTLRKWDGSGTTT